MVDAAADTDLVAQPASADEAEFERIAVVGMAGQFPGANSTDELWANLLAQKDGLHTFSPEELAELGIPQSVIAKPGFVPRGSIIDGYDTFDARRFAMSPREAAKTDPQARLFLKTCHRALEHAGYPPLAGSDNGSSKNVASRNTGVFAGCNPVDYAALLGEPDYSDSLTAFDQMIGNDRDFLATRVAFKLGLTGPALNLQSACSTSLVAVHLAAQHLLEFQCDMAIAGGVSLNFRQGIGYFYQDGMILSPDGRCRAFDAGANGTTLGQGSGAVILKRLSDALNDGDTIHAVIDGSAINNDGGDKISYTAPSRAGQAKVVAMAHSVAGIDSREVTYVEAHGTGTNLGDPVEIEGLTRAFRLHTDEVGFCRIGSIKSSIGHLDAAAGIAGFIKAVLCVKHGQIPATLHYEQPNPAIDFANSPFVVADSTQEWDPAEVGIRRAGISAFGIGGTNAHVVISEPPLTVPHVAAAAPRLVLASATSETSADLSIEALRSWSEPGPVSDAAVDTLWSGRTPHKIRRSFTLSPVTLKAGSERPLTPTRSGVAGPDPSQVWLFSGQGAQFPGVANGLGHYAPSFRARYEEIAQFFLEFEGIDVGDLLADNRSNAGAVARLRQTELTQPAIFTHQLAMASVMDEVGCKPSAVLGHSIGEFAALVVAGGLSWQDGARAVAARGRCMAAMPAGAMLATQLSEAQLRTFLNQANQRVPDQANQTANPAVNLAGSSSVVEIAALNTSQSTVASGPFEAIARLEAFLTDAGHRSKVLQTSHAFHSAMMDKAATRFQQTLNELAFQAPTIDVMCNLTGQWLTPEQATDPAHWATQMRSPVRFWQCLEHLGKPAPIAGLLADTGPLLLVELGPGSTLSSFALAASSKAASSGTASSPLGTVERLEPVSLSLNQGDRRQPVAALLDGLGALWCNGVTFAAPPDLLAQGKVLSHQKAEAPGSVLDSKPCWLPQRRHLLAPLLGDDAGPGATRTDTNRTDANQAGATSRQHRDRWLYGRSWTTVLPTSGGNNDATTPSPEIIVIGHEGWVLDKVCDALHIEGANGRFIPLAEVSDRDGVLDEEALALVLQTVSQPVTPTASSVTATASGTTTATTPANDLHVFHVASTMAPTSQPKLTTVNDVSSALNSGAHALLGFARVLAPVSQGRHVRLTSVSSDAFSVTGNEVVDPSSTALLGPIKVIPLEYSGISTSLIDIDRQSDLGQLRTVLSGQSQPVLAVRGTRCWSPGVVLDEQALPGDNDLPIRQGGHYLLVGGLGGVGLSIAGYLAENFGAKLTLTSRSGRPVPVSDSDSGQPGTGENSEAQRRLDLLEAIEAKACAVSIHQADAADPEQMSAVIQAAVAQNGPINGVFFGAGVADQAGAIHRRSHRAADDAVSAKVYGAGALSTALQGHQTDFVLLSSSIASELYHNRFGQVGYVTANSYIEAFAHFGAFDTDRLVTVAWDDWTDIGMSVRAAQSFREDQDSELDLVDELHSFSPEDGLGIFKRVLLSSEPVLYVSTTDLAARVERDKNEESPFLAQAIAADTGPELEAQSVSDAVRQVWVQLLGTDDFGDDDDFFELGGDSLQVARMADRLGNFVDQEIPLDLVFDNATVAKLSHALDQGVHSSAALEEVQGEVPLAPAQRRFLQRHSANPMYFNVSLMLGVDRPLDMVEFERIVARLVERHGVLRTRFSSVDPTAAVQLVGQESTVAVSHVTGPDIAASEDPTLSWAAHARQLQHSLDLVDGPVAAFCLYDESDLIGSMRPAGSKQQVMLLLHHMISDRLSLLQLVSEFDRLVGAVGSEMGPAPSAYSGWSLAMSQWGDSPRADSARYRWRALADELGPLRTFPQLEGPHHQLNESATQLKVKLDKADSASILSGGQGQPQAKLLLSLAQALAPLTSDPASNLASGSVVRFDCLGHGRRQVADVDSARTLGFFLSYCPVWVDPSQPHLALAGEGQASLTQQIGNNWTYDLLVNEQPSGPESDLPDLSSDSQPGKSQPSDSESSEPPSRDRLLQPGSVLFNFIGRAIESEPLQYLRILEVDKGPDTLPENNRDHPLAISAAIDETGCLDITFVYPQTALDQVEMEAVAARFVASVRDTWAVASDAVLVQ